MSIEIKDVISECSPGEAIKIELNLNPDRHSNLISITLGNWGKKKYLIRLYLIAGENAIKFSVGFC